MGNGLPRPAHRRWRRTVLAAHVERDTDAFAALDADSRNAILVQQRLAANGGARAPQASTILTLRLVSDWNLGARDGCRRGVAAALHAASIRVVLLQSNGAAAATLGPVPVQNDVGPPGARGTARRSTCRRGGVAVANRRADRGRAGLLLYGGARQ